MVDIGDCEIASKEVATATALNTASLACSTMLDTKELASRLILTRLNRVVLGENFPYRTVAGVGNRGVENVGK